MLRDIYHKVLGINKRTALLRKNILFSLIIKGWSGLVIYLMVPLTLSCLGAYKNGIWLTISSLLVWIDNLDIGLGNGLRNSLATHIANNDTEKAREVVSSTFAMLFVIIIPTCILLCIATSAADVYRLFNVSDSIVSDLPAILHTCIIFVCSTFIFKFIGNVYLGMQLPAVNNLLQAIGQTLALAGTFVVYLSGINSLVLIAIVNTAAPLIVYIASYPYTFYHKYRDIRPSLRHIKAATARQLFGIGTNFFIIQISGAILFMSSNFIISNLFTPEMVTPYQIAYRFFYIPLLGFTIIAMPYWSATTDAFAKGDINWIKQSNRQLNKVIKGIIAAIAVMIAVSSPFYELWVGSEVHIPQSLSAAMGIFMIITITSLRYSFILNGLGFLRLQLITTVSAAIAFIPLAYVVVEMTGSITAFMCVMCAVNLPGMITNIIQYNKIINNKASGIWIK